MSERKKAADIKLAGSVLKRESRHPFVRRMTIGSNHRAIFECQSTIELPTRVLTLSIDSTDETLGVKLTNHDRGFTNEMFVPGFASVGSMLGGTDGDGNYINTVARKCGIRVGDIVVAINGTGYRRFPLDYHLDKDDGVITPLNLNHTTFEVAEEEVGQVPNAVETDEEKVGEALVEEEAFHDAIDAADNIVDSDGNETTNPINDSNDNDITKSVDNRDNIAGHEFAYEGSEEEYLALKYLASSESVPNNNQKKNKDNQQAATTSSSTANKQNDIGRVIHSSKVGESYNKLLLTIRNIKCTATAINHPTNNNNPLLSITLERYGWDTRVHSWSRFVSANNGNVPMAMSAIQKHERWRSEFFPIDLTEMKLQQLLHSHAVSIIDPSRHGNINEGKDNHQFDDGDDNVVAPVVYIDFNILQQHIMIGPDTDTLSDDVIRAFVIYTETLLSNSPDPRCPTTSQFVDLSGVSLRDGLLRTPGVLKKLYEIFEPNYPETLDKMILYPVPKLMVRAVNAMLSFVNEHTRKKFVLTDDINLVCNVLGWDKNEIDRCGGTVNGYMKEHIKHGASFAFD